MKKDRQLRADGHHREHCCHEPVDAVFGPLETPKKSGIYRLTSGTSGRSAGDVSGGPEAQNNFNRKPPLIAYADEFASFLPAGPCANLRTCGVVLRPHSMAGAGSRTPPAIVCSSNLPACATPYTVPSRSRKHSRTPMRSSRKRDRCASALASMSGVMAKDGDIFGDGANVAARLEGLVKGGEIWVSRGVRDYLRHRGGMTFEDLGDQLLKNIAHPARAFRLLIGNDPPDEGIPASDKVPLSIKASNSGRACRRRALSPNHRATARSRSSWRFGKALRMAALRSSRLISSSIRMAPSRRRLGHGWRQALCPLRQPIRRHPRRQPRTRSILRSGTPSKTPTAGRSWKLIWHNTNGHFAELAHTPLSSPKED